MAEILKLLQQALAGRYRIQRELGRGGMATVFLAEDVKHRRHVAIKVLDPEVGGVIGPDRFLREIEIAARLTHPHILPVFDSGAADGILYYVMPYVEGESLQARLAREKQLPLDDALQIAREVADALGFAHGHGVVHRDIKPGNILLESGHAVVADFGLARAIASVGMDPLAATAVGTLTTSGMVLGTPAYMSPEQVSGAKNVDARSDLYSLGCVLYEMLAGQPPFTAPTVESLMYQHLSIVPRPVTDLRPAVPTALRDALAKALAKTPADRHGSTAEFAAALAAAEHSSRSPHRVSDDAEISELASGPSLSGARVGRANSRAAPRLERHGRLLDWRAWTVLAVVLIAGLAASPAAIHWLRNRNAPPPAKKHWILVAEFGGPADDSTLAVAARSLVSAALDQSELLATVPRDQIRLALQQSGRPASTRVGADLARELAYRRAVRAVLEGEIERIGSGYSVVLRVVDAENLRVVLTERCIAKNEDALIPALGKLAERLRRDLGEREGSITATRPMNDAATPSFDAYRLFVQAVAMLQSNMPSAMRAAIPLLREALALDRDFAGAWNALGAVYHNLQDQDSARVAYEEALQRPNRLSRLVRLGIEARLARNDGDLERSLEIFDRMLQYDPQSYGTLTSRSIALEQLGRFDEALQSQRLGMQSAPFGPGTNGPSNEIEYLCDLGRTGEARQIALRLPGFLGRERLVHSDLAACDWPAAESVAVAASGDDGIVDSRVLAYLASARAGRGALREASAAYERAEQLGAHSQNPTYYQDLARRGRLGLTVATGGAIPVPADSWAGDTSTTALITRGLRAAVAGDQPGAERLLASTRARPVRELAQQGAAPLVLEAWILGARGQWDAVVRLLRPSATQSIERIYAYPIGMSVVRWTLADAYQRLGQSDSSVVWLERLSSDFGGVGENNYVRGPVQSMAHQRLAVLYARNGRLAEAERHLAILDRWWDHPDDIARRLLDEAHGAVRAASDAGRSSVSARSR